MKLTLLTIVGTLVFAACALAPSYIGCQATVQIGRCVQSVWRLQVPVHSARQGGATVVAVRVIVLPVWRAYAACVVAGRVVRLRRTRATVRTHVGVRLRRTRTTVRTHVGVVGRCASVITGRVPVK